ncbi:MAG TPA: acyltransferase domain-containing protein [Planctomycetota bacterium]|nr:acyltransferase domain-containing protein [Planctomycetota bacterium]
MPDRVASRRQDTEAPPRSPSGPRRPWQLLALSGRTPAALDAASANLAAHLEEHPGANLADVAYTLQVGRKALPHRTTVLCRSASEAVDALQGRAPERVAAGAVSSPRRPIVLLFPGQASEHVNMALGLYRDEPDFRETVDACADLLTPLLGADLRQVIYPAAGEEEAARRQLARPLFAQPALFVVSYALAQLWLKWGVRPDAVIGYSTGEVTAACVAGVFSLDDALRIMAARGHLVEGLPPGAMLAVALSEEQVLPRLGRGLALAGVSGPTHCVVSGTLERADALAEELKRLRVPCRRLPISRAYHSEAMDPILRDLRKAVARAKLAAPRIRCASTMSGTWAGEQMARPDYWVHQLRDTVRFFLAMSPLLDDPAGLLLEVGPGQALTDIMRRLPPGPARPLMLSACRHPQAQHHDSEALLSAVGTLWLAGVRLDWPAFHAHERRRRVALPT